MIKDKSKELKRLALALPLLTAQSRRINTLENENEHLISKNTELENVIKSELYKSFITSVETPDVIASLKERLRAVTEQKNKSKALNIKLVNDSRELKEKIKDYERVKKLNERYKKQIKVLKEIMKEGK